MKQILAITLGVSVLVFVHCAQAQQAKKIWRIGFLSPQTRTTSPHFVEALLRGLRELGYLENQNIAIEYRWADGNFERLPELAVELVRLKVDVIVSVVTQASLAAKQATSTIPIVMIAVSDPVEAGIIDSLARPGANITGTSIMQGEITGKQLGLLKESFPKISRIAALSNSANPVFHKQQLREVEATAKALGVTIQKLDARDATEMTRAFGAIAKERTKALHILSNPMFNIHRKQLAELVRKHRLASVSGPKEYCEDGLLMCYAASFPESYHRAATYIDKILKGVKPSDIPVERPTKFEFVINLDAAKKIGVTVPQSVLFRADRVIKESEK